MRSFSTTWPWILVFGVIGASGVFALKPQSPTSAPAMPDANTETLRAKPTVAVEEKRLPTDEHPLRPHAEFCGLDPNRPIDACLRSVWEGQLNAKLAMSEYLREYLIVTIPDPSDPRLSNDFDAYFEVIQRAAEVQGYVLDRYWLPWTQTGKREIDTEKLKARAKLHEIEPGTLLFRKKRGLLTVFLVGETPSSGIQKQAFLQSIDLGVRFSDSQKCKDLRIVGPVHSGSAESLRISLKEVCDPKYAGAIVGKNMRVVSGAAMAIKKDMLTEQLQLPFSLSYKTTVISTDELMSHLDEALEAKPVAMLRESNTTFGRIENKTTWMDIPFPLHVSDTLTAISRDQARRAQARGLPAPGRYLTFPHADIVDGPYAATSAQAPTQTNITNDLILSNILSTISRENIPYVGLHATNPRDKILLASSIREHCPDVRLFTLGTNLLLAHPEYAFAMRGTLVVSTYPLHPTIQRWSYPYAGDKQRLLFSQQGTQGTYNAILWQLGAEDKMIDYSAPKTHIESGNAEQDNRPAVWFSLVSPTGRLVPLRYKKLSDCQGTYLVKRNSGNPTSVDPNAKKPVSHLELRYDTFWATAVIVLSLSCGGLFWAAAQALRNPESRIPLAFCFRMDSTPVFASPGKADPRLDFDQLATWKQASAVAACLGAAVLFFALVMYVTLIAFVLDFEVLRHDYPLGFFYIPLGIVIAGVGLLVFLRSRSPRNLFVLASVAATVLMASVLFALAINAAKGRLFFYWLLPFTTLGVMCGLIYLLSQIPPRTSTGWSRFVFGVLALIVAVSVAVALALNVVSLDANDALFFERTVSLSTGLSALLPTFFLCLVFFAWGAFHLKRCHLLHVHSVSNPFVTRPPAKSASAAVERLGSAQKEIAWSLSGVPTIEDPNQQPRSWCANISPHTKLYLLTTFLILLALVHLRIRWLPTYESPFFEWLFLIGFPLAAIVVGVTFVHFWLLWRKVRYLILRRMSLMPLDRAFAAVPKNIADMLRGYLYTRRPHVSDFAVPIRQYTRLRAMLDSPEIQTGLKDIVSGDKDDPALIVSTMLTRFEEDLSKNYQDGIHENRAGKLLSQTLESLREATAATLEVLEHVWNKCPPEDVARDSDDAARGDLVNLLDERLPRSQGTPTPTERNKLKPAVREWLKLAETFVATQSVLYVSQFFVHLRTLLGSVTLGAAFLLLAATSYPFQPQTLLLVYLLVMVGIIAIGAVAFLVQLNVDRFISRAVGEPEGFTPDWAFVGSFMQYVVPLLGVFAIQFSGAFRAWLEPIFQIVK